MVDGVRKAVEILDAVAKDPAGVSARQLATKTSLPRSTAQRLLQTLQSCQMVQQNNVTKRYELGSRMLQLGASCLNQFDVRATAVPHMRRLQERFNETVGLNIRVGDARMYIEQIESPQLLRAKAELGQLYPLYSGSPGRTLLAFLDDSEIDRILGAATFERLTEHTPTDAERVWALIAQTRRDGYATAFEETIRGLNTIAAPVRDFQGTVEASLSVSAPTSRFSRDVMETIRPALLAAAEAISGELGYRADPTYKEGASA